VPQIPSARLDDARTVRSFLLACDGAYAAQLATCLRSIVESNRTACLLDIHVLVEDFPLPLREKVLGSLPAGSATIRWIEADVRRFTGYTTLNHVSRMTFARLLIPAVMPEGLSRVLYLDADIVVLHDLSPLWEIDLEGCPVGAVADPLDALMKATPAGFQNVPRVRSYFNAGVLVIDLPRWREEQISENALRYLQRFPSTRYSDQDALNAALDGHWKELDAKWNYQDHLSRRIQDLPPAQQPAVVHFITALKPWKPTSLSVNASFYDRFRKRTLFARTPREIGSDAIQTLRLRARRLRRRFTTTEPT
jgi:lipopolysaccharide biosynthesis glycosyltransferase